MAVSGATPLGQDTIGIRARLTLLVMRIDLQRHATGRVLRESLHEQNRTYKEDGGQQRICGTRGRGSDGLGRLYDDTLVLPFGRADHGMDDISLVSIPGEVGPSFLGVCMLDRAKLSALHMLPKNTVSRAVGALSDLPLPTGVRGVVNKSFASFAGIDVSESERTPSAYGSVNEFFTRRLKDGARQVADSSTNALVSPCDGRLSHFGKITRETLVQAKGRDYRLVDLLDSGKDASQFVDGSYATIYLAPRDYHRVHFPITGTATRVTYVPGHLFPVNPYAVENIDQLFAVNERLITYVENDVMGRVGIVMVGATCVGRMSLTFHHHVTNGKFRRRESFELPDPVVCRAGDELGMFNLGSTVVLVISAPRFEFLSGLAAGQTVRMGQLLGRV